MTDRREFRPPEPPLLSVATVRQALQQLDSTWQISIEDHTRILLFDDAANPRGYISLANGQVVLLDTGEDEL